MPTKKELNGQTKKQLAALIAKVTGEKATDLIKNNLKAVLVDKAFAVQGGEGPKATVASATSPSGATASVAAAAAAAPAGGVVSPPLSPVEEDDENSNSNNNQSSNNQSSNNQSSNNNNSPASQHGKEGRPEDVATAAAEAAAAAPTKTQTKPPTGPSMGPPTAPPPSGPPPKSKGKSKGKPKGKAKPSARSKYLNMKVKPGGPFPYLKRQTPQQFATSRRKKSGKKGKKGKTKRSPVTRRRTLVPGTAARYLSAAPMQGLIRQHPNPAIEAKKARKKARKAARKTARAAKAVAEAAVAAAVAAIEPMEIEDMDQQLGQPVPTVTVPITNTTNEPIVVRGSYISPRTMINTPGDRYGNNNTYRINGDIPLGPNMTLPVNAPLGSTLMLVGHKNGDVKTALHIHSKPAGDGSIVGTQYTGSTMGMQRRSITITKATKSAKKTKRKKRGGRRRKRSRRRKKSRRRRKKSRRRLR